MKQSVSLFALASLVCAVLSASAATRYVNLDNSTPAAPYTTWPTAATNIQDAVDIAVAGDEILVTNGVYQTGARAVYGMSNRVAVTKPVTLRSVNGPQFTVILGYQVPDQLGGWHGLGTNAIRCVYLTNGAVLAGFALTNGATQTSGNWNTSQSGGGVFCTGPDAVVSKCVLIGNSASRYSGGAFSGTLNNCALTSNYAGWGGGASGGTGTLNNCALSGNSSPHGGGAYLSTLNSCTLTGNSGGTGAGVSTCVLNNCVLAGNSGAYMHGGADNSILNNCTLTGNSAYYGGGAGGGTLNNCTLVGNSANYGGGTYFSTLNNCIIYHNRATATGGANYDGGSCNYTCTTPLPPGPGNLTNAPLFVDTNGWSDLRLQSNSPCINAGRNTYVTNFADLDGNPRIVNGTVDMGAYEFQGPGSTISYAWLQQFGLPTDGSADATDPDSDVVNNWQEWRCATDPTNALSVLRLLSPAPSGTNVVVSWQSVAGVSYAVERSTNLGAAPTFSLVQSNLPGQPSTTTWTDTNALRSRPGFYRVRVGN